MDCFQHKAVTNVYGDRYANYPDLIITHGIMHVSKYHNVCQKYNYYVSIKIFLIKKRAFSCLDTTLMWYIRISLFRTSKSYMEVIRIH